MDPNIVPADPLFLQFWISARAGSEGNISSLKTWTAAINWLHELNNVQSTYKEDRHYRLFITQIKRQYGKRAVKRLPFMIDHIVAYLRLLGVVPGRYHTVPFDHLLYGFMALAMFFTMSRPSELFRSLNGYNDQGITMKDVIVHKRQGRIRYFVFTVKKYKNQQFRQDPKFIPFGRIHDACSSSDCLCALVDVFRVGRAYMKRRAVRARKWSKCNKNPFSLQQENPLFVNSRGKEQTTKDLRIVANRIASASDVDEAYRYTGYSFRIGGTTLASNQGVSHARILQFVGWAENRLPDASHHYIQDSRLKLSSVPRSMIHGKHKLSASKPNADFDRVYDPWATSRALRPRL